MVCRHISKRAISLGLKDRQQEVGAVLAMSRYIGDKYMSFDRQYMYYIPLTTLLSGLSIDIKHIKII